ncbi:MAG: CHAT domain-containing protein [bacterium]
MREEIWNHQKSYQVQQLQAQLEAARYELLSQRLRLFDETRSNKLNQPEQVHPLSIVRKNLRQAQLGLLYYHISDDASFVLVAAEDSIKIVRLQVSPSSLVSAIDSLISPLHNVREDSVLYTPFKAAAAHELYQQLVKPAEDAFDLPERLLIVPDLALMNLPFEMLLVEKPAKAEYTPMDSPTYANHFLQNRYTFVYSPSTSLLQDSPKPISHHPNVMVFANPFGKTFDSTTQEKQLTLRTGWRFEPLIFAKSEANGIKAVYEKTRIYEGENATKERFFKAASNQRVLHFATHAFADTTFDAFSGLVLAVSNDSTDDGMLMGYEISDLNLNCDLVTLSACETGRGKLVAGEGVLGLPRLFLGTGANTVLMTQWKVDDKFASELMPEFYKYYLKEGHSKIDALGEAKRNVLQRQDKGATGYYQHPFYWASFTLYGDPGRERKPTLWPKVAIISAVLILILTATFYKRSRTR